MDISLVVDAGLRAEFIDESLEMLSGLEPLFVELEADPTNIDIVQAIFRPIHSIKGNSFFFGFPAVKTLAHEMETVLDRVRQKTMPVTVELIGVELAGVDVLKTLLERGRAGLPEVADQEAFDRQVEQVKRLCSREMTVESLSNFVLDRLIEIKMAAAGDSAGALVEGLISDLMPYTSHPAAAQAAQGCPPALARLREILEAPLDSGALDPALAAEVEFCLKDLGDFLESDADREALNGLIDNYHTFMASVGFDALLRELLLDGVKTLGFIATAPAVEPPASPVAPGAPAKAPAAQRTTPKDDVGKTMRVSEQHVDTFLSYVGELLVVRDMLNHLESRLGTHAANRALRSDFRRINETFASLSNELQRSIMSIRLVAVGTILQRVPRIVRDVASATGKDIEVVLTGEKIEVDKSLLDLLEAPLTHMVRNAADHGIESPERRRELGKRPAGRIKVGMRELPNFLSMVIEDDGGGLDYARIHKKAVELEIVAPGQQLTEADIVNFLFQSGVSTADQVTDISGRGVGMDVVKRMVEEAGGAIEVSSKAGEGTRFEVRLPKSVTTQIFSGFLVVSGGQRFIFSLAKVLEITRVDRDNFFTIRDRCPCFRRLGRVVPFVRLDNLLKLRGDGQENGFELVVTFATRHGILGIGVDQVVGVQQVVLRRIDGLGCTSEAIAGGALMGDGAVALIIDVDRMHSEYAEVVG